MQRRKFLKAFGLSTLAIGCGPTLTTAATDKPATSSKPNVIYIMLDEWGYYELSGLGHTKLKTPNIDKLFLQGGKRMTQCLAGAPVCGPTRACLMTGKHAGHTSMRANTGSAPIRAEEKTVGDVMRSAGYATGGYGKWGIGGRGTSGVPEKHGFDEFFGYYDQVHAHSYYPPYLIRNSKEVPLEGNTGNCYNGKTHAHGKIWGAAMDFVKTNIAEKKPFFCYMPLTYPHGLWGFDKTDPAWAEFKDKPWTARQKKKDDAKIYAAMLFQLDRQLGEMIAMLKEKGLEENTVIFLTGDNGGQDYFQRGQKFYRRGIFAPNVDPKTGTAFRGGKGSLTEGGLRVPYFVRWPGTIKPATTSDHLCAFSDVMATLADIAGAKLPAGTDSVSFLPTLLDKPGQTQHEMLYWEYVGQTAVRKGNFKAFRPRGKSWQLFDLSNDISEKTNVAGKHPAILKEMIDFAEAAHTPIRNGKIYDETLLNKDHNLITKKHKG
ncbi:MAG: arylsulfatase [Phycisphaerales bacterium]|jgi:arylsulfatase A|nr:arylsulfatase [Phycisphaerales bacterium]MBT7171748.1 arylsulfatase [Phycisphaerales bacterium]